MNKLYLLFEPNNESLFNLLVCPTIEKLKFRLELLETYKKSNPNDNLDDINFYLLIPDDLKNSYVELDNLINKYNITPFLIMTDTKICKINSLAKINSQSILEQLKMVGFNNIINDKNKIENKLTEINKEKRKYEYEVSKCNKIMEENVFICIKNNESEDLNYIKNAVLQKSYINKLANSFEDNKKMFEQLISKSAQEINQFETEADWIISTLEKYLPPEKLETLDILNAKYNDEEMNKEQIIEELESHKFPGHMIKQIPIEDTINDSYTINLNHCTVIRNKDQLIVLKPNSTEELKKI